MITRILALLVMGFIGLFTIAFPITTLTAAGSKDGSGATGIVIALLLTAIIVFTGRARSVWSRLCLVNGLAGFALPLVAIAASVMVAPKVVNSASFAAGGTYASDAGATAGAVLGGALVTGAAAFIGFFVGAIFLALAFFLRNRHA